MFSYGVLNLGVDIFIDFLYSYKSWIIAFILSLYIFMRSIYEFLTFSYSVRFIFSCYNFYRIDYSSL